MVQERLIIYGATIIGYVGGLFVGLLTLLHDLFTVIFDRMRHLKSIRGELAVVTGGAGGLGTPICLELAKQGCHIAVVGVNLPKAQKLADRLRREYADIKAYAYSVDITKREAVMQLRIDIERDFKNMPTIVINNAGIMTSKDLFKPEPEEVQHMINVNLTAHFWMIEAFLPSMKERQHGHIVAINSIAGQTPFAHFPAYSCTKYGARGLMRCLRLSLKIDGLHDRIRTTIVYPYFINSNETVLNYFNNTGFGSIVPELKSEDAGRQVVHAIQSNKDEVNLPSFLGLLARVLEMTPLPISDWILTQVMRTAIDRVKKSSYTLNQENTACE